MRSRLEAFERRLAALHAVLGAWSEESERERQARERRKLLAAVLRAGLECAGVDPGEASALRRMEDEEAEPQPKPFVHPLRRLAEREKPRTLIEVLDELTRRYQKGRPPNLRSASAMQLIGYYCFGPGNQGNAAGAAAREAPA